MEASRTVSPTDFLKAMALWMQSKKYRVGIQPKDVNLRSGIALAKHMTEITAQVVASLIGGGDTVFRHYSGGAKSDKVVQALAPFVSLAELIGLRFEINYGHDMMLVILADNLTPQEVVNRFNRFMELADAVADLGYRINFQRMQFEIYPVVVYFNAQNYHQHSATILSQGWLCKFWAKLRLRACTVNLPEQTVAWADVTGMTSFVDSVGTTVGADWFRKFRVENLHTVLSLAQQSPAIQHQPSAPGYNQVNSNSSTSQVPWQPGRLHPNYSNVIAAEEQSSWYPAPGYKWVDVNKDLQVVWESGQLHRNHPNVVAGEDGKWYPVPGYRWVDVKKSLQVVWQPKLIHRNHPNVIASEQEGVWSPAEGYRWVNSSDSNDFRVVWCPGRPHEDYPNVVAGEDGKWYPVPGYRWVDVKKSLQVVWTPGHVNRDSSNVVAAQEEGNWQAAPGYKCVNPTEQGDLRVIWVSGQVHRDQPHLVSGQKEGEWRSTTENNRASSPGQAEKVITSCPTCSQKLRAPSDRGTLTLSCPKCKHSWQWNPSDRHL